MHLGPEAERRGHDADAEAEVAGGTHRDAVAAEDLARCRAGCAQVVAGAIGTIAAAGAGQTMLARRALGELQHLVDAAARSRAGHRQAVVGLEPERAERRFQSQGLLHGWRALQGRFDGAAAGLQFREQLCQQRGEAGEAVAGGFNISQTNVLAAGGEWRAARPCAGWSRGPAPQPAGGPKGPGPSCRRGAAAVVGVIWESGVQAVMSGIVGGAAR